MIEINSENNDINSDELDITNFAKLPHKKIKQNVSKKDLKIAKKQTAIVKDENCTVDESCYCHNDLKPHFIMADRFDILIIQEILQDPYIPTFEISVKLDIPLSIVHKKRKLIESSLLTKKYFVDLTKLGIDVRFADILVDIQEDKIQDFVTILYSTPFHKNIIRIRRIKNDSSGICIKIAFQNSSELFFLMDKIKSHPFISNVHFSEEIEVIEDNSLAVILHLVNGNH